MPLVLQKGLGKCLNSGARALITGHAVRRHLLATRAAISIEDAGRSQIREESGRGIIAADRRLLGHAQRAPGRYFGNQGLASVNGRRNKVSVVAHGNCNSAVRAISDRRNSLKSPVAVDTDVEQHRAGGLFRRVFHAIGKRAIHTA